MANDKTLELQIKIAAEEAARLVSSLKDDIEALSKEAEQFADNAGADMNKTFEETEAAAKDTASSITDIKSALGRLAEVAAAAAALNMIKDMGSFAMRAADNFQIARNQFGVLLGDMEAGAGLFERLRDFRDITPFNMDTLTQATNMLISAQVPLDQLETHLTRLGDLSMGNSQRFASFAQTFSQAAARGTVDMRILNQYLSQGVPIIQTLARNFGVASEEIVQMANKGKISFADFSAALEDLTAVGGQFFGGMEVGAQSLAAVQESLSEATKALAASFGEMLLPVARAFTQTLIDVINVMNESPIAKGIFVGALVAVTSALAVMAVQAIGAFAATMKLNLALGIKNPKILASTLAVAGLAAGITAMAARQQQAIRETEQLALRQLTQRDATDEAAAAIARYTAALREMTEAQILNEIQRINNDHDIPMGTFRILMPGQFEKEQAKLTALHNELSERRTNWIDEMFGNTQAARIQHVNEQLAIANRHLSGADLTQADRQRLQEIVRGLNEELARLTNRGPDINKMAADWKAAWANVWEQFQADQRNDPFVSIEIARRKTLEDAHANYIRALNKATLDQINEYYNARRREVIRQLYEEEGRIRRSLTSSRVDDIQHELREAIKAIDILEAQRIAAAEDSAEAIAAIRKRHDEMRADAKLYFQVEIDTATLAEAREAVRSWQDALSDSMLQALLNIENLSDRFAVILSDLTAQLVELSAAATLSGFEEFGRALGQGENAAESMSRALTHMAQQILRQLPMMFLQAGLQLIMNNQWPMGLAFIAAAGSSAIVSGFVDGRTSATAHAQGGVFDEYGQAARAFAAGGAFTNQIVSTPTYFRYGGGFNQGLMGEAGPEAIMPLTRMPNGDLGVQISGGGSKVVVNVINYSGADVRREESESADGGKQIDVIIGDMVNRHMASGKADRVMSGRYGLRAQGV